jgi:hypothetical protein
MLESMEPQKVTLELDVASAEIILALQEKAEAQGKTLDALLLSLIGQNGAHEPATYEPVEDLLGVFDSREPFERPTRDRDAFGRGVIAKLEKQGLKLP